ncbi:MULTISPECIES: tRNA lysidine(34) synthetase TilS [unclassified Duganella]|uniref:tRNA lysidine(34) synthetase TilS n=1 Tax=unclassified Duganella TaxID=2636909 RepID=UPI0008884649|nr:MULTISPECIES: tRNA lysidine(34) synthetase TilS [unclassified Duganella]SDG41070.1 tRNA(Ile)-lysidine synthase [Duganella sp. OV458]SDJ62908.1 tRNA(Ile)-lysidine synthase [Duganella sp. OV510]
MKQQKPTLTSTFEQAVRAAAGEGAQPRIAIALSGGLDSSALLHLAHAYAQRHDLTLCAFHIHHGLSPNADAWLAHCEQQCADLNISFEARRIQLQEQKKTGTEAAARKARYAALGALCQEHHVQLLLTAHHQDDQAETVLLQLLRGSGPAGLSGMDAANTAAGLLQNENLVMARPLLQASRKQLEAYAAEHNIRHIHDESNDDPRYARNALRHTVMPALEQHFPGFQERFARSAHHAQSATRLLAELAEQDLAATRDGDYLDISKLRALSQDRAYNLLRHWFATRGVSMPSTAWLAEMLTQLLEAKHDAQLLVTHPDCHVRRYRDRLHLTPKLDDLDGMREDQFDDKPGTDFRWNGEAALAFPAYGGVLHFEPAEQGFDPDWLRTQNLLIEFRRGGEKLKLAPNRSTRPVKYHYQALNIPAWERGRLPVVKRPGQLLFAAGIGMDCHHVSNGSGRIRLRWQAV